MFHDENIKHQKHEYLHLIVLQIRLELLISLIMMSLIVVQIVLHDKLVLSDQVVVLRQHLQQHLVLIINVIGQIIDEVVLENVLEIQATQSVLREFHIVVWVELLQLTSVVLLMKYVV